MTTGQKDNRIIYVLFFIIYILFIYITRRWFVYITRRCDVDFTPGRRPLLVTANEASPGIEGDGRGFGGATSQQRICLGKSAAALFRRRERKTHVDHRSFRRCRRIVYQSFFSSLWWLLLLLWWLLLLGFGCFYSYSSSRSSSDPTNSPSGRLRGRQLRR